MSVNDEMFDLYRLVNVSADVRILRRTGDHRVMMAPPDGRVKQEFRAETLGAAVIAALRYCDDPQVPWEAS